jgi:hypothetical protein
VIASRRRSFDSSRNRFIAATLSASASFQRFTRRVTCSRRSSSTGAGWGSRGTSAPVRARIWSACSAGFVQLV